MSRDYWGDDDDYDNGDDEFWDQYACGICGARWACHEGIHEQYDIMCETLALAAEMHKCSECGEVLKFSDVWYWDHTTCFLENAWLQCPECRETFTCFYDNQYQIRMIYTEIMIWSHERYKSPQQFDEVYARTIARPDDPNEIPF